MKIERFKIEKILISEVEALDPVTVYVENYDVNQAKVIIECYGKSWSSYWGGLGGTVSDFFKRTNVGYLVNCFDRGISSTTDKFDEEKWFEEFVPKLKKRILEKRREDGLDAEVAREWYNYDFADNYSESFLPLHQYDTFKQPVLLSFDRLFYDEDDWNDFCSQVKFTYERNSDYDYLCRIVKAVQVALTLQPQVQ